MLSLDKHTRHLNISILENNVTLYQPQSKSTEALVLSSKAYPKPRTSTFHAVDPTSEIIAIFKIIYLV